MAPGVDGGNLVCATGAAGPIVFATSCSLILELGKRKQRPPTIAGLAQPVTRMSCAVSKHSSCSSPRSVSFLQTAWTVSRLSLLIAVLEHLRLLVKWNASRISPMLLMIDATGYHRAASGLRSLVQRCSVLGPLGLEVGGAAPWLPNVNPDRAPLVYPDNPFFSRLPDSSWPMKVQVRRQYQCREKSTILQQLCFAMGGLSFALSFQNAFCML